MTSQAGSKNDATRYFVQPPTGTSCLEFFTSLYAQAHPDEPVPTTAHEARNLWQANCSSDYKTCATARSFQNSGLVRLTRYPLVDVTGYVRRYGEQAVLDARAKPVELTGISKVDQTCSYTVRFFEQYSRLNRYETGS